MNKRLAVLIACFFTVLTSYAIRYSYGVLLPEMLPSLDITKTEAGVIYSAFFIAYTVLSPILGLMGDRYNMRIFIPSFVVLLGGGAFLMAYPTSIIQASFFFTLAGIGSAACWAPVMALAQRWTSDRRRGMTLAFVDLGSSTGIILTGAVLPLIVSASGWQSGWTTMGILGFAVAVMGFTMMKNRPEESAGPGRMNLQPPARESISAIYKKLLGDRRFWLIGLAYLLTGFCIQIPFTFLSTYAVQELSFSYGDAARLITVVGIGAMAGKLTLGPLSDKVGRIQVMMICAGLIAAGTLGMAYSRDYMLTVFTAVFGIGYGALWAMYAASAADHFSREAAGSIVGLWTFYLGIGLISSPIIAGWTADTTGTLSWAFVLAAGGGLISLLLLVTVWRMVSPRVKQV